MRNCNLYPGGKECVSARYVVSIASFSGCVICASHTPTCGANIGYNTTTRGISDLYYECCINR